ncbi:MAG: NHLP family bacteriocin export ABC transporter peptidase/permease/ATPase subunit [Oscillospiraceae bacterium]|nr:NHLP family bacteriocin export ABC transporter peptidase/permease/ATPase subunit [Candidatus Ruminococcus equi]
MAKKRNVPVKKGVAKVPVVMQLETLECGAASLTMILSYYGKWIPLERVRRDCGVSRDGSNAKNILKAAKYYNLNVKAYRYEADTIRERGTFPCIIHWNFNHFVVLDGFKGNKAYLNDPAKGAIAVPMSTFEESFTGICLEFEPSDEFEPEGKPKSMFSFAKGRLTGSKKALLFTAITSIIASLVAAISPAFSRIFLDRLLTGENPSWIIPFIAILLGFDIIQIVMSAISEVYGLRIGGKMAAIGNTTFMWHVLRMPMSFFSQRMAGDIQNRQESNANIAKVLMQTFAPLVLQSGMMIFYFIIMIRYSLILTAVGLGAFGINAFVSRWISKKRINITRVSMRDTAKLNSNTISGIDMIETIKASGAENGYFAKWSGYQASANTQLVKFQKTDIYMNIIPEFMTAFATAVVLFLGVYLTFMGEFTVGMVMAFQGFLTAFMQPAQQLLNANQMLQEMRTQMERVDDVLNYPCENVFADEENYQGEYEKLSGKIELKNISFGYSPLAEPLIKDFNLSLEPGKSVALVGSSGCGKSTISKLISGLYEPWEGEILFDSKKMSEIDSSVFHGSLAVVDQDVILFEDTIANNIKMWDNSIEDFEMILAARDAQIHDDIMKRPLGYQHKLIEGGRDFSGGQRQRMEIARVLAQDPTVIILDEATSALDAKTEYEVVKAIKNRGIACIVVAHRLSTIRSCDEIIVMDKGNIVDRGTHKELLENSKLYCDLVTSE